MNHERCVRAAGFEAEHTIILNYVTVIRPLRILHPVRRALDAKIAME